MERASLGGTSVRAGREAGALCGAACLDIGRTTCTCVAPPLHAGNVHCCPGDLVHKSHVWPVAGAEVPPAAPAAEAIVECPNCQTVFSTRTARTDKDVTVKHGP
jgi:hypothetical protein